MDSILLLHDTKYECRVPEGLHELCKDISHKVCIYIFICKLDLLILQAQYSINNIIVQWIISLIYIHSGSTYSANKYLSFYR